MSIDSETQKPRGLRLNRTLATFLNPFALALYAVIGFGGWGIYAKIDGAVKTDEVDHALTEENNVNPVKFIGPYSLATHDGLYTYTYNFQAELVTVQEKDGHSLSTMPFASMSNIESLHASFCEQAQAGSKSLGNISATNPEAVSKMADIKTFLTTCKPG